MNLVLKTAVLSLVFFLAAVAGAAPGSSENVEGGGTDAATFKEVFESNLRQSKTDVEEKRRHYDMEFAISSVQLQNASLSNSYYEIAYADQVSSQMLLKFYSSYNLPLGAGLSVAPGLGIAYSYQETILRAKAKKGGVYKDVVRVQWAPLFLGTKLNYRLPIKTSVTLFTRGGFTYDWFSVSGSLDGISQSYWSPAYNISVGANLFEDAPEKIDSWFGGLILSGGVNRPLAGARKGFEATSIELGVRFLL